MPDSYHPGERVLAIDYGERRIGLALSEPGQMLVKGLPTIDRGKRRDDPLPAIETIVREHQVGRIVLGLPYTMAGEEGPQAAEVRVFEARLAAAAGVPVETWDERLSSEAARRQLRELGYDEKAMRERVDQLAAVMMLEAWLSRRGSQPPQPEPAAPEPPLPPPLEPPPVAGPDVVEPPPRRGRPLIPILLLLLLLAALGAAWWVTMPPAPAAGPVRVTAEPGTSLRRLARELEARDVIRWSPALEAWLRARGEVGRVQAGTYEFTRDETLFTVADRLVRGLTVLEALTIPEGLRLEEVAATVGRRFAIDSAAFAAAAVDPALADSLLSSLGSPAPQTLEGYLFPETYRLDPAIQARPLARAMVGQFHRVFGASWQARAESLGFSVHEIVTLASIVEEEAQVPEERTTIAGVFWNRLRRGMPLEADPTVQYALGGHRARVLYRDLEVDSPYNTYRNVGLPPGPIASPGRGALEATLYPDSVPYLYFFAIGEGGRHTFSETYEEHLRKRRELGR